MPAAPDDEDEGEAEDTAVAAIEECLGALLMVAATSLQSRANMRDSPAFNADAAVLLMLGPIIRRLEPFYPSLSSSASQILAVALFHIANGATGGETCLVTAMDAQVASWSLLASGVISEDEGADADTDADTSEGEMEN